MNPYLKKPLFHLPPVTRHMAIFVLGLMALMSEMSALGAPPWGGFINEVMALGFVLIGLALAVGRVVRGGSKAVFAVECLWMMALPGYISVYVLVCHANYMIYDRH